MKEGEERLIEVLKIWSNSIVLSQNLKDSETERVVYTASVIAID